PTVDHLLSAAHGGNGIYVISDDRMKQGPAGKGRALQILSGLSLPSLRTEPGINPLGRAKFGGKVMTKTLVALATLVAFGFAGIALAAPQGNGQGHSYGYGGGNGTPGQGKGQGDTRNNANGRY